MHSFIVSTQISLCRRRIVALITGISHTKVFALFVRLQVVWPASNIVALVARKKVLRLVTDGLDALVDARHVMRHLLLLLAVKTTEVALEPLTSVFAACMPLQVRRPCRRVVAIRARVADATVLGSHVSLQIERGCADVVAFGARVRARLVLALAM